MPILILDKQVTVKEMKHFSGAAVCIRFRDQGTYGVPNVIPENLPALVLPLGRIGLRFGEGKQDAHRA